VQQQVFLAATGPGAVSARRIESGEYGRQSARIEPRIRGAWQMSADGYRLELRVPLSMLGKGFGVLVDDRDARGALPVSYGTLRPDDLHTMGQLILAAPELGRYLTQFLQPFLEIRSDFAHVRQDVFAFDDFNTLQCRRSADCRVKTEGQQHSGIGHSPDKKRCETLKSMNGSGEEREIKEVPDPDLALVSHGVPNSLLS